MHANFVAEISRVLVQEFMETGSLAKTDLTSVFVI